MWKRSGKMDGSRGVRDGASCASTHTPSEKLTQQSPRIPNWGVLHIELISCGMATIRQDVGQWRMYTIITRANKGKGADCARSYRVDRQGQIRLPFTQPSTLVLRSEAGAHQQRHVKSASSPSSYLNIFGQLQQRRALEHRRLSSDR